MRPRRDAHARRRADDEKPLGKQDGFAMIFGDRYLMLIAALTVLLNVVNTSGEYLFGRYVVDMANATHGTGPEGAAAREAFIGGIYSQLLQHRQPRRLRAADVRGLARASSSSAWARRCSFIPIVALSGTC